MAFASIFRKSANSLAPLAIRLTRVQRNYHSCIFTALNQGFQSQQSSVNRFYPNTLRFSTAVASKKPSSDESLIRVLESEIQCAEEDGSDQVKGTPSGFPFEIEDIPGIQTVELSREYNGELVKVDVHMLELEDEQEEGEDNDEDDYEDQNKTSIPLVVTVSKKDGTSLEFSCTATADQIAIDSLCFRSCSDPEDELAYEGPDFGDLDENLQKGFHKYLEVRGINPNITNFLHEYMINKDSREYLNWLKNLKKFVEE
ncbi:hypothetical protein like AT3G55605 [Hibiscus trionum]|uniref:Mitochondrial glycoprotein n=1 Tax=Hibiscus trionum TaxID=183268 RepID=A0A9W7HNQ4_HIBTR|nr:hypothetical protein like AT3G55605 [Hibiscus trionum]